MPLDFSLTSQDAKSLLVYNYNKNISVVEKQLNDYDYVFDAPAVNTGTFSQKNTALLARPIATSGKYGLITIYYNRIDLASLTDFPMIVQSPALDYNSIIASVNDWYGLNLTQADYVASNQTDFTSSVSIVAKPTSLMFIGTMTLSLAAAPPPQLY